jgi:hypothetical protein
MVENGHRLFLLTALNVEALDVGTWTVHISPLCYSCTWYPPCTEVYCLPVVEYSSTARVHSTGYYVTFALSASPYSAYLRCMSLSNSLSTPKTHTKSLRPPFCVLGPSCSPSHTKTSPSPPPDNEPLLFCFFFLPFYTISTSLRLKSSSPPSWLPIPPIRLFCCSQ